MKTQKISSDLISKREIALKIAIKNGFADIAEDLAQDVCVAYLSGRNIKTSVFYVLIDCWRKNYGRNNIKYLPLTSDIESDDLSSQNTKREIQAFLDGHKYRYALELHLMGYSNKEIASKCKVSESAISLIVNLKY